jgi:exosortase
MTPALTLRAALGTLPPLGRLNLALLAVAVAGLSAWLWRDWSHNPDLSHGFFMPLVFLLLLHESRRGTPRYLPATACTRAGFGLLLAGGIAALVLAGLYAAAVDWSHALVNVMLALSLAFLLSAGVVVFASRSHGLVPLNWPAGVAVLLWLLVVPLPPGTYSALTLNLQMLVSEGVLRALHLLGIAAVRHGNIIDLANTSVGVEEACSGVRSLISCVFAGLFFSATLVQRPVPRAVIIALSAPLALGMNFLRSLALTLLANHGVDIAGTWHDATGFAVLGVTAAILGGLALLLDGDSRTRPPGTPAGEAPAAVARPRGTGLDRTLTVVLGVAFALVGFFVANTRTSPAAGKPAPDLLALLPESFAGWRVKTSDLYEFRGTLQTDHLAQRHYVRGGEGPPTEIVIYVAYWHPGQAPVSLVASHTPDACWPGSGWVALENPNPQADLTLGPRTLPRAEHRIFKGGTLPQNVWFWHLYDQRPIQFIDPYSPVALLRLAVTYGFRRSGEQAFIRISSNRPWSELADEPLLAEFFRRAHSLGL